MIAATPLAHRLRLGAVVALLAAAVLTLGSARGSVPTTVAGVLDELLVTNGADLVNGDVARVEDLRARPGPDGISLREAIDATNNDPGTYAIRFDAALAGTVIRLLGPLPALTGGGVDLDGDTDGDGSPDITIHPDSEIVTGLHVASSGNRIAGLAIEGFELGAIIGPPPEPLVPGQTFADNTLAGLVLRDVFDGIDVSIGAADCSVPCASRDVWLNTTITGTTIEAEEHGIMLYMSGDGDRVEGTTIADNRIRISGPGLGPGINAESAGDSTGAQIIDLVISGNVVEGTPDTGIQVGAGGNRAQGGLLERVQVLDNRVLLEEPGGEFWSIGITVEAGSDTAEIAVGPPVRYMDDNVVRDVIVRGNSITGVPVAIEVQAGQNGGSRNSIEELVIEDNVVRSTHAWFGSGAMFSNGASYSYLDRPAEDNQITGVVIRSNEFTIDGAPDADVCDGTTIASAIGLLGGGESGRGNLIRDVGIDGNVIETDHLAIAVVGGLGPTAQDNVVDYVRIGANRIPTPIAEPIFVTANCLGATGNLASVTVTASPSPAATTPPSAAPSPSSPSGGASDWDVAIGALAVIAMLAALLALAFRRRRAQR